MGTAVEWIDATQELKIESEVRDIVAAAQNADFTERLNLVDKDGFMRELSEGVNNLIETSDTGGQEVARMPGVLAQGDLTNRITNEYHGAFGKLGDDLNATVAQLTDTISTASKEIASGNTDLSQRTEEQASSLEETAASMEELTSTVKLNAKQANQLPAAAESMEEQAQELVKLIATFCLANEHTKVAVRSRGK
ncbi:MAG: methyl-accepting chemotaxis [Gallionellaceae bacterium]|nr:MAG: methyl-accepting chemotaxis [Gallionellaceae bacterium]